MRQLFSKSRQSLIIKSDVRKYFLYAIGEIGLVVIGILIALSIDNWNEDRKDRIKEQEILVQVRKDYKSNLLQLEEKIGLRESIIKSCKTIINGIDSPSGQNSDSLMVELATLMIDPTFDPVNDDLINSGNIRLVRNQNLKRLLTNLSSDVAEVREIEEAWKKLINEILVPLYIELGISRDVANRFWNEGDWYLDKAATHSIHLGDSRTPPNMTKVLANQKLEGILSTAVLYNYSGNIQSNTLKNRILEILNLLDKEIKEEEKAG